MIEISEAEFNRIDEKGIIFSDVHGQQYCILDGILLIVRPTKEEYDAKTVN